MARGNGRHKKRRVTAAAAAEAAQAEAKASSAFLAALEAQRANARRQAEAAQQQQEGPATTIVESARPPPVALPGFYYDETKKRYFPISPATERRQRELKQLQLDRERMERETQELAAARSRGRRGRVAVAHNWAPYLARRESDFAWSARGRDRLELVPQLLSSFLTSQVVEAQDMDANGRLTALALHPSASNLGAMGSNNGDIHVLGVESARMPFSSASTSQHAQRVMPMMTLQTRSVITSLQWRPISEMDLLVSSLGQRAQGASTSQAHPVNGTVALVRVGEQETPGFALLDQQREWVWKFVDPWTAKWDMKNPNRFCVGGGGPSGAAYVDITAQNRVQHAPTGKTHSDVHAQAFYDSGKLIINGTKSGALWGWDLRAPRRCFEWEQVATADLPASSVLDIHVLEDCRSAVVQRSNGELRLVDMRTLAPVVEFASGAPKRYLPQLRCAVDEEESVVMAGGDVQRPLSVNAFHLHNGRRVASVDMQPSAGRASTKKATMVQQVQLKPAHYGSRYAGTPEIWALSRNELYICSRREGEPLEH